MPGGTGVGGTPSESPEGLWNIGGLSGPERMLGAFKGALGALSGGSGPASSIPAIAASQSGQTRDYLSHAVGLLRFGANVQGFEFHPSIALIAKDLRSLANGLTDYRVPLKQCVDEVFIPSIRKNFQVGGRPSWEPLAQNTIDKHRDKLGLGATPILVRSGALRQNATSDEIWSINAVSAVIKDLPDDVWYGVVHQGGKVSGGNKAGKWFEPYKVRARNLLGPNVAKSRVEKLAW